MRAGLSDRLGLKTKGCARAAILTGPGDASAIAVADALPERYQVKRLYLNLCGATILKLENAGGIVVSSKKH